jgi:ribosome biogenesis GTPase
LNKADLCDENELRELQNIYQNLGYRFLIVSAFNGLGLKDLAELFAGKVSVLCGRSGVGKSSILNKLDPNLRLDVDQREKAIKVGRHTTTASQLFSLNLTNWLNSHTESWIADTPGFSPSELNHPESRNLHLQFPELAILAEKCQFDDCLHQAESGCNILSNKEEISPSRLESYYLLLEEAKQSERMLKSVSRKVESKVKNVAGSKGRNISIPKLSKKYRQESKRQSRQSLQKLEELETEDNNSKQHFFEE